MEKQSPGPKPKVNKEDHDALLARVEALETVIATMAHQSGIPNSLLTSNGITPYTLTKADLRKYS